MDCACYKCPAGMDRAGHMTCVPKCGEGSRMADVTAMHTLAIKHATAPSLTPAQPARLAQGTEPMRGQATSTPRPPGGCYDAATMMHLGSEWCWHEAEKRGCGVEEAGCACTCQKCPDGYSEERAHGQLTCVRCPDAHFMTGGKCWSHAALCTGGEELRCPHGQCACYLRPQGAALSEFLKVAAISCPAGEHVATDSHGANKCYACATLTPGAATVTGVWSESGSMKCHFSDGAKKDAVPGGAPTDLGFLDAGSILSGIDPEIVNSIETGCPYGGDPAACGAFCRGGTPVPAVVNTSATTWTLLQPTSFPNSTLPILEAALISTPKPSPGSCYSSTQHLGSERCWHDAENRGCGEMEPGCTCTCQKCPDGYSENHAGSQVKCVKCPAGTSLQSGRCYAGWHPVFNCRADEELRCYSDVCGCYRMPAGRLGILKHGSAVRAVSCPADQYLRQIHSTMACYACNASKPGATLTSVHQAWSAIMCHFSDGTQEEAALGGKPTDGGVMSPSLVLVGTDPQESTATVTDCPGGETTDWGACRCDGGDATVATLDATVGAPTWTRLTPTSVPVGTEPEEAAITSTPRPASPDSCYSPIHLGSERCWHDAENRGCGMDEAGCACTCQKCPDGYSEDHSHGQVKCHRCPSGITYQGGKCYAGNYPSYACPLGAVMRCLERVCGCFASDPLSQMTDAAALRALSCPTGQNLHSLSGSWACYLCPAPTADQTLTSVHEGGQAWVRCYYSDGSQQRGNKTADLIDGGLVDPVSVPIGTEPEEAVAASTPRPASPDSCYSPIHLGSERCWHDAENRGCGMDEAGCACTCQKCPDGYSEDHSHGQVKCRRCPSGKTGPDSGKCWGTDACAAGTERRCLDYARCGCYRVPVGGALVDSRGTYSISCTGDRFAYNSPGGQDLKCYACAQGSSHVEHRDGAVKCIPKRLGSTHCPAQEGCKCKLCPLGYLGDSNPEKSCTAGLYDQDRIPPLPLCSSHEPPAGLPRLSHALLPPMRPFHAPPTPWRARGAQLWRSVHPNTT